MTSFLNPIIQENCIFCFGKTESTLINEIILSDWSIFATKIKCDSEKWRMEWKKYCRCGVIRTANEKSGTRDHAGSFSREIRCRCWGALVPPCPLQRFVLVWRGVESFGKLVGSGCWRKSGHQHSRLCPLGSRVSKTWFLSVLGNFEKKKKKREKIRNYKRKKIFMIYFVIKKEKKKKISQIKDICELQIHRVRWTLLRRVHRCVAAGMHRDRVGIGCAIFRSPPRRQLREKSNAARMAWGD